MRNRKRERVREREKRERGGWERVTCVHKNKYDKHNRVNHGMLYFPQKAVPYCFFGSRITLTLF